MIEKRKVNTQSSQSLTVSVSSHSFRKSSNTKSPPPPPESKFSEPSPADSDSKKRQRMDSATKIDRRKKSQCWVLLMRLLIHPHGASLKKPFNPQVLGLETIQAKLSKGSYLRTREFADDMRVIFYQAMDSNPPRHELHKNARQLSRIFESNWKVLEEKWAAESEGKKNSEVPVFSQEKKSHKTKKGGLRDSQQFDDTSMTDAANGSVKKRKHVGSRDFQHFDDATTPQSRQKKQKSYSRLSESRFTDGSESTPSGDYLRLKFQVQADSTNSSSQRVFTRVNISESKLEAKEASSIVAGRPKYQYRDPLLTAQKNLLNFCEASKKKHEENEARIRAAMINKERQANRLRLEEMERSVDIEDNLQIFRELDRLCGHTLYYNMQRLGLKLKAEWDN